MKAQFVFFAEMVGITMLSTMLTVIPMLALVTSLFVLIFCGKKLFMIFWAVTLFAFAMNIYIVLNLEYVSILPMLNLHLYGSHVTGFVTNPTPNMVKYAANHYWSNVTGAIIGISLPLGVFVYLSRYLYKKIERLFRSRVVRWNP